MPVPRDFTIIWMYFEVTSKFSLFFSKFFELCVFSKLYILLGLMSAKKISVGFWYRGLTSSYILFSCMIKSMLTMCRYSHTIYVLCFLSAVIVYTLAAIDVLIPDWLFYIWGITVQKSVTWWFRSLNPSAVVCLILCRPARHNWLCVLFMVCFLY